MRLIITIVLSLLIVQAVASGQQQPFIFTVYGGLFFPSNLKFKEVYQTNSEKIWGGGVCLPLQSTLFVFSDISFFQAKGMINPSLDSILQLDEKFIHAGLLNKQPLTKTISLRLFAGLSYATVKQTSSSSQSREQTTEADKKIGYFLGAGVEELLDESGRISLFSDISYDYRRSQRRELYGDFGGIRFILGVHIFLS